MGIKLSREQSLLRRQRRRRMPGNIADEDPALWRSVMDFLTCVNEEKLIELFPELKRSQASRFLAYRGGENQTGTLDISDVANIPLFQKEMLYCMREYISRHGQPTITPTGEYLAYREDAALINYSQDSSNANRPPIDNAVKLPEYRAVVAGVDGPLLRQQSDATAMSSLFARQLSNTDHASSASDDSSFTMITSTNPPAYCLHTTTDTSVPTAPDDNIANTTISNKNYSSPSRPNDGNPSEDGTSNVNRKQLTSSQLNLVSRLEAIERWDEFEADRDSWLTPIIDHFPVSPNYDSLFATDRIHFIQQNGVRMATWNMQRFTVAKAKHPGYLESVCLTILRSGVQLCAVQEIADPKAIELVCKELNQPSLPHIKRFLSVRRGLNLQNNVFGDSPDAMETTWRIVQTEHGRPTGRMFRSPAHVVFLVSNCPGRGTTGVIKMGKLRLLEDTRSNGTNDEGELTEPVFTRSPCHVECQIAETRFLLVCVHLKATGLRNSQYGRTKQEIFALAKLVQAFYETRIGNKELIILGDFNLSSDSDAFDELRSYEMKPVLPGNTPTTLSAAEKVDPIVVASPRIRDSTGTLSSYDNIWLSKGLQQSFGDQQGSLKLARFGVVSSGLRHPFIPDETGAGINGSVSDHCPVWFDLVP